MAQIIVSVITWNLIQADGSSNIRETHTDDQGNEYTVDYSAPAGYDTLGRLANDATQLQEALSGSTH